MVRSAEQKTGVAGERIKKRKLVDAILLEMFSLKELPEQRMTAEEQKRFGKRVAAGDKTAKQEYLMRRLRFAMAIAISEEKSQPDSSSLTLEDHFQIVIETMQNRLDEYMMHSDQDFEGYMGWSYRVAEREYEDTAELIRLPAHIREKLEKRKKYEKKIGRTPSAEEVSATPGITEEEALVLEEIVYRRAHDTPSEEVDSLESPDTSVFNQVYLSLKIERLLDEIQKLPDREKEVLELRFGLKDGISRTLEEVGQILSRSNSIISRVEMRALDRLRVLLEAQDPRRNWLD